MRFISDAEGVKITIELFKKEQTPSKSFFKKKQMVRFDIHFTSSKNGKEMTHISQDHLLPLDQELLESEAPELIEELELIEHILHHWLLEEREEQRPEWFEKTL